MKMNLSEEEFAKFIAEDIQRKAQRHHEINQLLKKGQIVMAGSSLMELFPIEEMVQGLGLPLAVYNRGLAGDTIDGQLKRMDSTFWDLAPSKVFINIGSNDISAKDYKREILFEKYSEVLQQIKTNLPHTIVYILAYYPVNRSDKFQTEHFRARTNQEISIVNAKLPSLANFFGYNFIDLFTPLLGQDGNLPAEITDDGMHLKPQGYKTVLEILLPYLKA